MGFAGDDKPSRIVPNLIAKSKAERKTFIGPQFDTCNDFSGLQFKLSMEKGYPTNWETLTDVWTKAFAAQVLDVNPADSQLMLTIPPLMPDAIATTLDEMIFEHFNFESCCMMTAATCAHYGDKATFESGDQQAPSATLVVDAGFSYTHVVPVFDNQQINFGVRRIDVGGKLLTNHLKQVISHRQWNVMEETHMINQVKEALCYVTEDIDADLRLATRKRGAQGSLLREYVMPDYINVLKGFARDPGVDADGGEDGEPSKGKRDARPANDEQVLSLGVERFAVPELLFNPSDIGMEQAGIAEAIVQSVKATIPDVHDALYSNVLLTGGSTLFPNFQSRLEAELRPLVPIDCALNVRMANDPIAAAWQGASKFAAGPLFKRSAVTRDEYMEHGSAYVRRACHN